MHDVLPHFTVYHVHANSLRVVLLNSPSKDEVPKD